MCGYFKRTPTTYGKIGSDDYFVLDYPGGSDRNKHVISLGAKLLILVATFSCGWMISGGK
jgi:hypothetical protein